MKGIIMYKKKIVLIILFFVLQCLQLPLSTLHAKVRPIGTRRELEQAIAKNNMVIVLFYEEQRKNGVNGNKDLIRMYDDISMYQPYNDADILFLKINTKRKDLAELAQLYKVNNIPEFIFFHNGRRVVDSNNKPIAFNGVITRSELQAFIDDYYGQIIQQYIQQKDARKRTQIAEENESWKPYFYPRDVFVRSYDPAERNME